MKSLWNRGGGTPLADARRNGVRWNDEEDRDLMEGYARCRNVRSMAHYHERLPSAISIRLCRLHGVTEVSQIPVTSLVDSRELKWVSQDGRTQLVANMGLDHLLNAVNDSAFRVARMRAYSINSVGGLENPNLNVATKQALASVTPGDVFPAWAELTAVSQAKFHAKFGVTLTDTRDRVRQAWTNEEPIPTKFGEAVRFYLNSAARAPARLESYLNAFLIVSDDGFQRMCWNLRVDQPTCWSAITTSPKASELLRRIKHIPNKRRNSAIDKIVPNRSQVVDDVDDWLPF